MLTTINPFINKHFVLYQSGAESLAIVRILYCVTLFQMGLPHFDAISGFEPMFYNPPPRLAFLPMFYDESWWNVINILSYFSLFMVLIGLFTPFFSSAFFLINLFGLAKFYSFGKIDHNFFVILTPLLLGFAGWGSTWSVDSLLFKKWKTKDWPVNYLAFCIGLSFVTAAVPKIAGGWLNPEILMSKGFIAKKLLHEGVDNALALWLLENECNFFFKFLDYSTILIELLFISLIFHRRFSSMILFLVCLFHLGVLLMMSINFSSHMLAYLPFLLLKFERKYLGFSLNKYLIIVGISILVLNFFELSIFWISAIAGFVSFKSVMNYSEKPETITSPL
ncbi:MAG: hypothetical protein SNJ77_08035 [Cytophagales bacterium]